MRSNTEVILDRDPISGVFCLHGKVSFLHFLHNLLKIKTLIENIDRTDIQNANLAEAMLNPEVICELLLCVKVDVAFERAEKVFLRDRGSRGGGWGGQMVLHGQVFLNCRMYLTCDKIGLKVGLKVSFEGKFEGKF